MDPCCAVCDWTGRRQAQAPSFLPPFHSPWLLLCAVFLVQKCHVAVLETSCPHVLLPTPALRGPISLQSHPLQVVIVAQGKGRELKHSWLDPGRTPHCYRCGGPGWGGWQRGWTRMCALLSLIYHSRQNGHSCCAGSANILINKEGKKQVTGPPPHCNAPADQGQVCPLAVFSLSPRADTHCTAWAVPHPSEQGTLPWHGDNLFALNLLLHLIPQKQLFTCLHWLLHGPNFTVRLQRTIFGSDSCSAAYFSPFAHCSTCNLKIYLYTISAANMVFFLVFSVKPITGSFCYLPNFFCFDNIFLALYNPYENCKYL